MGSRTLYVGLDSTQYSNRLFTYGKTREICVAVFSTDPRDLQPGVYNEKRDFSVLEMLSNGRDSMSMVVNPDLITIDTSPLVYSGAQLASFYIENVFKGKFERLEFHIDGPLHVRDRRYLKEVFRNHGKLFIDGHKKCWRQGPKIRGKRQRYCIQPRIVIAADALSNYLFIHHGLKLFTGLDSRDVMTLKIQQDEEEKPVEHYHVSAMSA